MPNQNQFLFDYVNGYPELAESLLREEVRKEAKIIIEESPIKIMEIVDGAVTSAAREYGRSAFFECFVKPDEDLRTSIRRDAYGRVLEIRKAFIDALNIMNAKINRLEKQVRTLNGEDEYWQEDQDEDTTWGI